MSNKGKGSKKTKKQKARDKKHNPHAALVKMVEGVFNVVGSVQGFMGGTGMAEVLPIGLHLVSHHVRGDRFKKEMAISIAESRLRTIRRDWTLLYGFIIENDEEDLVEVGHFHLEKVTAYDLDRLGTEKIKELWIKRKEVRKEDESFLGNVWIAIPRKVTKEPEELFWGAVDLMEKEGAFNKTFLERGRMINIMEANKKQAEAINESVLHKGEVLTPEGEEKLADDYGESV